MIDMDIFASIQNHIKQQHLSTKSTSSQRPEPHLWVLINDYYPQASRDFDFWWRTTGIPFASLLENAGYSFESQCQNLLFFYCFVVPELGAGGSARGLPGHWKSFMTDHFSLIEFSWEWGCGGEIPTVRLSIEPIGPYAGTAVDPLNQYTTARLVHQYQHLLRNCDLQLFDHFSKELLSYSHCLNEDEKNIHSQRHRSRTFVGFDFGDDGIILKAYLIPTFKAAEMGQRTWTTIFHAIQNLPDYSVSLFPGLLALQSFLTKSPLGSEIEAEIFAIDCVAPVSSRLKIYMRSQSTSFVSVREFMTLGGVLDDSDLNQGLKELQELWKLVLSPRPEFSTTKSLPEKNHRTAGILYYFDLKQGKPLPGVKVYIPVRHYGQNDLVVVEGLKVYLRRRGQGSLTSKYLEALKSIAPSSSFQSRCGIQTYLGCSIVGKELKLTSYIAPEVYKMQLL